MPTDTPTGCPYADAAADRSGPSPYAAYLQLDRLLGDLPDTPAERHFIVVHQAIELHYRVLADDLAALVDDLDHDRIEEACTRLRRIHSVMRAVLAALDTLHHLDTGAFHRFRAGLGSASGLQSLLHRQIEILSGLGGHEEYVRTLLAIHGNPLPPDLAAALSGRNVAVAHQAAVRRAGPDAHHGGHEDLADLLRGWQELWTRWREIHLAVVHRHLGTDTPGTGGKTVEFLARLQPPMFPHLAQRKEGPA